MKTSARSVTTRNAILDAADRLLARYGYKKMTIDDLAQEVGIGKGSIYLHFESKEDVALSQIDRTIERLKASLYSIAQSKALPETKIRKMLVERVMTRFDSVQHHTKSLDDLLSQIRPKLLERRKRYFEEEARIFADVLAEGKRSGTFTLKDPLVTGRTLIDATNSLLPYSLSANELFERNVIETKAGRLADLILNGLINR